MTASPELAWPPAIPSRAARAVPVVLCAAVVALQIAYPLVHGAARDRLTVVTVLVFFAASVSHAAAWRGLRWTAIMVAVTAGGGFAAEAAGVATGWPFGDYAYAGTLGAQVAGVPLVIPLAWTMMGYPALLVGRAITTDRWAGPLVAGWALASWDLFLDPQMVDAGHWVWTGGGPAVLGIPLSNFSGWALVAVAMMGVLWRVGRRGVRHDRGEGAGSGGTRGSSLYSGLRDDRPMYALYLWVYVSSVVAHLAFFDLPGSALLGGVGMGAIVAAFGWSRRR